VQLRRALCVPALGELARPAQEQVTSHRGLSELLNGSWASGAGAATSHKSKVVTVALLGLLRVSLCPCPAESLLPFRRQRTTGQDSGQEQSNHRLTRHGLHGEYDFPSPAGQTPQAQPGARSPPRSRTPSKPGHPLPPRRDRRSGGAPGGKASREASSSGIGRATRSPDPPGPAATTGSSSRGPWRS
jgi:hypothetical protein